MKTITIAAYNRPDHLRQLLDSLRGQLRPLDDYALHIRVDAGGDRFTEVMEVAASARRWAGVLCLTSPHKNRGINRNTYWLMQHVFDEHGADYNVYLEDDLVLSPDAFNLVEWYIDNEAALRALPEVEDIGVFCLCRLREHGAPGAADAVYLSRAFVGWGFVLTRHQWEQYAQPGWRRAEQLWGRPMMWDNSMANYIRVQGATVYNAFPALSRVTNTGREGVHFTPSMYDEKMTGHRWQQERRAFDFQLEGIK